MGSADDCVAPGGRQPRETRLTSDGRLYSPETNLKVGLLPLFFMQLLLSHMFLSFMVRTSSLRREPYGDGLFSVEKFWQSNPPSPPKKSMNELMNCKSIISGK